MSCSDRLPISFPPIRQHGIIGDRRTGALVAADGTVNWFCVPNFDGTPLFGALLDPERGGFCRLGPARASMGQQYYLSESAALVTCWGNAGQGNSTLELADIMASPANERPGSALDERIIVRRLLIRETTAVHFEARPRWGFGDGPEEVRKTFNGAAFCFGAGAVGGGPLCRQQGDELGGA